jgi:hypothetical protein
VDFGDVESSASPIRDLLTDQLDQRGLRVGDAAISGQSDLSDVVVSRAFATLFVAGFTGLVRKTS